jgi:DNA-binding NarL/FixJ family response regulator
MVPSGATVLLIDDDPEDLQYWSMALKQAFPGHSILQACGGQAGLDLCRYQQVDCVVLELAMAGLSGVEVMNSLWPDRHAPRPAVVALTRRADRDLHEAAYRQGAHACLVKGRTTVQELDEVIGKAMAAVRSPTT